MVEEKKDYRKVIMGVLIAALIVFSMAGGAILMCKHSGGVITKPGYVCSKLNVIGLCERNGNMYVAPEVNISEVVGG